MTRWGRVQRDNKDELPQHLPWQPWLTVYNCHATGLARISIRNLLPRSPQWEAGQQVRAQLLLKQRMEILYLCPLTPVCTFQKTTLYERFLSWCWQTCNQWSCRLIHPESRFAQGQLVTLRERLHFAKDTRYINCRLQGFIHVHPSFILA